MRSGINQQEVGGRLGRVVLAFDDALEDRFVSDNQQFRTDDKQAKLLRPLGLQLEVCHACMLCTLTQVRPFC